MLLNDDVRDIERTDEICSTTFVVNEFLRYFYIHQVFLINIQDLYK